MYVYIYIYSCVYIHAFFAELVCIHVPVLPVCTISLNPAKYQHNIPSIIPIKPSLLAQFTIS